MEKLQMKHDVFMQRVAQAIANHKRQIIGVVKNRKAPAFTYTIGNQEKGLPELLIIGNFDPHFASVALTRLSDRMIEQKRPFNDHELVDFGGQHKVAIWDAPALVKTKYTVQAGQFYRNEDYKVQQVVIPDRNGRWPYDAKCHKAYKMQFIKGYKSNGGVSEQAVKDKN